MWYINNPHVRSFSDAQAHLFRHTTANMISVYRMCIAIAIPFMIYGEWRALGAIVFAVAVYLDFIDGAVARHQKDKGEEDLTHLKRVVDAVLCKLDFSKPLV